MWLEDRLKESQQNLSVELTDYLLGRGVREDSIQRLGFGLWSPCGNPSEPDSVWSLFCEKYGEGGRYLRDHLVYPIRSGYGTLLGLEARRLDKKNITKFFLPSAKWNALFFGLPQAVPKVWGGGNLWLVEGIFDLTAMEHIVPENDAVVASMTAHLSQNQLNFFKRYCRGMVNVVYDNDKAGRQATHGFIDEKTGQRRLGVLELLKRAGVMNRDYPYSGGKDPGEIWEKSGTWGLQKAFRLI